MSYSPTSLPLVTDWRANAACIRPAYQPIRDFWFADDSNTDQVQTAVTICGHCPVKDACLTAAVTEEVGRGEQSMHGIRGALTAKQRWLKKKRETRRQFNTPRPVPECGTTAAYDRHIRNGEPIDDACRAAHNEYRRKQRGQQANADADNRLRRTGTTLQRTA